MERWWTNLPQRQQRVVEGLLGWEEPRPPVEGDVSQTVTEAVEGLTADAAATVPAGQRLTLAKAALDALDCDGRFLDREDTQFAYSPAMVRGQLAHAAITLDLAGRRQRPAPEVLRHAWATFAAQTGPAAAFVRTLGAVEVDALRSDAQQMMLEFRDVFPLLPEAVPIRAEPALAVSLHQGRLSLFGRPDFVLGRVDRRQRRMLLLDLKSGQRHIRSDRSELRFYALISTLKYGVAPFRTATFYLDEGSWDAEDVTLELLLATARDVGMKAARAATLKFARPADDDLRLVPGPACRWCSRAASCPAVRPRVATAA